MFMDTIDETHCHSGAFISLVKVKDTLILHSKRGLSLAHTC